MTQTLLKWSWQAFLPLVVVCGFFRMSLSERAFAADPPEIIRADVVVYGGTSSGVAAAVQVSRMGRTAVIIEPGQHPGGLSSGGLGFTDSGDKRVIGGISREFYRRIRQHYDDPGAWIHVAADDYPRYRRDEDAMWTFEPRVAEAVFESLLAEAEVPMFRGERLNRETGVLVRNNRIEEIHTESGKVFRGIQFVDATYEGDLMAAAGVRYTVGRESNSTYGETLNGNQTGANVHNHRFIRNVSPWLIPGDPQSGLLPGIEDVGPLSDGEADHRVQGYCFRMCLSNVASNQLPFPKPPDYDESRYELLLRNFESGDLRVPLTFDLMPNGKTDSNNNGAFSTDYLGGNYAYPEADYAERERIIRDHESYQKGLMWTLASHPRVPESVRQQMAIWGLPKDEFVGSEHWPHQLYVREARRMVSDYVVTEMDCRRERLIDDSVGLGSYNMDSHNVRRFVTADGYVQNEGDVQVSPGGAYLISYRSIVPAKGQISNLSVPVCISASHIAYGSIRMEPVFMILGQSAATAAVLAIERGLDLQEVPYPLLRERLLQDGQVLDLPPNTRIRPMITVSRLPGITRDADAAEIRGLWVRSSSTDPFVGNDYLHDGNNDKDEKSVTWRLQVPHDGQYEVRLSYSAFSNRATNVPVTVASGSSSQSFIVNQRKPAEHDGLFHTLGLINLRAAETVIVTVTCQGTDGFVIVDAVQLLSEKP